MIGRQPWRFNFYREYRYTSETQSPLVKLYRIRSSWPELENELVEFLLANPQYSVNQ